MRRDGLIGWSPDAANSAEYARMKASSLYRLRSAVRKALLVTATVNAMIVTELRWRRRTVRREPHHFTGRLIVSLTSYPKRFRTLAPTIKCLLSQSVLANATVLWLAEEDLKYVPRAVLRLQKAGLEIRTTRDLGPFTKIMPSLQAFPDAFIVTADDDVYYDQHWLMQLVRAYDLAAPTIVCHRAHRVCLDAAGRPLSYLQWNWEVPHPETSPYLFPTGVGGVLYFPDAFSKAAQDATVFLDLTPKNDDLWLYWMERCAGLNIKTLGQRRSLISWFGSQRRGLNAVNVDGSTNNDVYIERLFKTYKLPLALKDE